MSTLFMLLIDLFFFGGGGYGRQPLLAGGRICNRKINRMLDPPVLQGPGLNSRLSRREMFRPRGSVRRVCEIR